MNTEGGISTAAMPASAPRFVGRTLLVLGGKPIGSCDIVTYARSTGARVIVTDWLDVSESPAKAMADESWDISTSEVDVIVKRAREAGVDAVFTGAHEFNLRQAAEICRQLDVPFYATALQIEQTSNKAFYKALFARHGIDTIAEFKAADSKTFPVLIKPTRGSGAYGIRMCADVDAFARHYADVSRSKASDDVLIEQYVQGDEITAFYLIRDGQIHLTAVADRLVTDVADGTIRLPYLYRWPSSVLTEYRRDINPKMIAAMQSLGLANGMVFVQCMRDGQRFLPYDMGFRLTGTQEYHLLERICGLNALKMLVDFAMTGRMGGPDLSTHADPTLHGRFAAGMTFLARPGTISAFVGLDRAASLDHVVTLIKNHAEGTIIPDTALGTLNQVVLRAFLIADSETALNHAIRQVAACVRVIDRDGHDMLIPSPFDDA